MTGWPRHCLEGALPESTVSILGYWSGLQRACIFPPVLQNKATISTIIFLPLEEAAGAAELNSTSSSLEHGLASTHTTTQGLLP